MANKQRMGEINIETAGVSYSGLWEETENGGIFHVREIKEGFFLISKEEITSIDRDLICAHLSCGPVQITLQ